MAHRRLGDLTEEAESFEQIKLSDNLVGLVIRCFLSELLYQSGDSLHASELVGNFTSERLRVIP